ncbi:MAG: MazG nucleotide pyrophosphohydrolase [Solirubrobacterales bacterium]|nr:MazG nucleotide pyrophosphohydrolase [Solirubrobacterales bacterium]
MAALGGSSQQLVRATMIAAGGYWRPLAATARLLEELGELAEQLDGPREELGAELADLWIITTALADQFLGGVPEPGAVADGPPTIAALLAAAGPIARVVNHYDGPKVPRTGVAMPSLHVAVAGFQAALGAVAAAGEVDLGAAVAAKIEQIHARGDIERFGREGFDPSAAPVLGRIAGAQLPPRLWGAPDPIDGSSPAERAAALAPTLTVFAKAARAERLEGFVIEGPEAPSTAGRSAWLGALVRALDPAGDAEGFELAGVPLSAALRGAVDRRPLALVVVR